MSDATDEALRLKITTFLRSIAIAVLVTELPQRTFLPGLTIRGAALLVDPARLLYPGDMLHEADHIAVAAPARRATIDGDAGADAAEEMMAIAWSYAAARHIGIDPAVVFHDAGYRGDAAHILAQFDSGNGFGVPMLQWLGMTYDTRQAQQRGVPPFPHMLRWLREAEPPRD
jgi:hypothetical protein